MYSQALFDAWIYGYVLLCVDIVLERASVNAVENTAIEARNVNFSIVTKKGSFMPILNDSSIRIPSRELWMLLAKMAVTSLPF